MPQSAYDRFLDDILDEHKSEYTGKDMSPEDLEALPKLRQYFCVILKDLFPLMKYQFAIVMECLPHIFTYCYGSVYFTKNRARLSRLSELRHSKTSALIIVKRQHGKTEVLVRILGACLLCFPNMDGDVHEATYCLLSHKGDHAKANLKRLRVYLLKKIEFLNEFTYNTNLIRFF
jgi:hypothetical protein